MAPVYVTSYQSRYEPSLSTNCSVYERSVRSSPVRTTRARFSAPSSAVWLAEGAMRVLVSVEARGTDGTGVCWGGRG